MFVDKVLRSAWANAEAQDVSADEADYVVSKATVDPGPIIYRGRPASQGRYVRIRKRTSHINIEISAKKSEE
jgi:large subunit ribosomal protein L22